MDPYDIYKLYNNKDVLAEIPLLTNDGIVIPKIGLLDSLKNPVNQNIPLIAGSNRDESSYGSEQHFILFN